MKINLLTNKYIFFKVCNSKYLLLLLLLLLLLIIIIKWIWSGKTLNLNLRKGANQKWELTLPVKGLVLRACVSAELGNDITCCCPLVKLNQR